ncbi:MAG: hypothetical protein ACKV19_10540 [Verrucomicrobiales bacterium]
MSDSLSATLKRFATWLDSHGETSWDHQSYFAGGYGAWAKGLYYRHKLLGTAAVSPMIVSEAVFPSARRLFHHRTRFPIADAHYAMGFAYLYQADRDDQYLQRAIHFLEELKKSRSPGYDDYCWGYPFDWVTRNGTIAAHTPFITTLPYVYEAFHQVYTLDARPEWRAVMESIVRHATTVIRDFQTSPTASSCTYGPHDEKGGVINASAYRAFLLTHASQFFDDPRLWAIAERNLNFVLENQQPDGSWPYAVDGVRDFVDHFHTCFVMKALAKIHSITGHRRTLDALGRGVTYYLNNLFDTDGLPKPFSVAPRLTVYRRELYDCAESINLCLLLRDRFPSMGEKLDVVVRGILADWIQPSGAFRARQLRFGWDNTPMHRWAQSQMFRSLALCRLALHQREQ